LSFLGGETLSGHEYQLLIMRALSLAAIAFVLACDSPKELRVRATRDASQVVPDSTILSTAMQPAAPFAKCNDRIIRDQGIGPLRIGISVDSVMKLCRVVRDTVQQGIEGMPERRITVAFPAGLVEAEIVDGKVWRLDIDSPAFRTRDSLGVGSTVADLLRLDEPDGGVGEGAFFLISRKHCGQSYQMSGGIPTGRVRRWGRKELEALPSSVRVTRVLVFDCHGFSVRPGSEQKN